MSSDDQASRTEFVQRELERMHVSNLLPDIYRNVSFNNCLAFLDNEHWYIMILS